jgi:hypothetical protein
MRARPKILPERRRPVPGRRGGHTAGRAAPAPEPAPPAPEDRVREAGGPEDVALYNCQCGLVFEASVSTSVSCPHCGTGQAW